MAKNLTAKNVQSIAPPKAGQKDVSDTNVKGFGLRIGADGKRVFFLRYRAERGGKLKQVRWNIATLDVDPSLPAKGRDRIAGEQLAAAREQARAAKSNVKNRRADPAREEKGLSIPAGVSPSYDHVLQRFLAEHVNNPEKGKALRSAGEIERAFSKYITPNFKGRPVRQINRAAVSTLLDRIAVENGPVMADRVLAYLSKMFKWWQLKDDEFSSPIVPGMARTDPDERKRKRILHDDELRVIWPLLDEQGTYGALCKVALLTGQRRSDVAGMRWQDIEDGVWSIPRYRRAKGTGGKLPLPDMVQEIITVQPKLAKCPYVFAGRSGGQITGWSPRKRKLDATIEKHLAEMQPKARRALVKRVKEWLVSLEHAPEKDGEAVEIDDPFTGWTIHDLRRTCRSLMSAAGVSSDDAERALGHTIRGVRGIYERPVLVDHNRAKGEALEAVAAKLSEILNPQEEGMRGAARKR